MTNAATPAAPVWRQLAPVLFLTVIFFINFIGRIIFSPLLPTIENELSISHGQAGSLFFLISAGYLLGLLGSGFFAARSTHKWTIVFSSASVGFVLLGISLAHTLWWMRAGLLILGLVAGLYMPSAIVAITSLTERRHWGKAIAVHEVAPNLAFFAGPFVAELFLWWWSWRAALGLIGAASLITSWGYYQFGEGGEFPGEAPSLKAVGLLVRAPAFWLMLILFGLGVSSTIGVYAMLPVYLVSDRHINQSWANTVVALSRSYGPILGVLGGLVSDKLGPKQTIVISLIFTGVLTLLLGWVSNEWISAVVVLQPLLAVWFFPAAFAVLAVITSPATRNLAVSFTVPAGYILGGGVTPTFIGFMGDAGLFPAGFLATGGLILAGAGLALLLKLPGGQAEQK